ncbi:MAG: [citrate (pro-3S)-lyase] ligase [Spirochaetaceae bacterium]|nr:[citrate (pro-3S)-lyase] ligase [Spirochaetaceae bacterium]
MIGDYKIETEFIKDPEPDMMSDIIRLLKSNDLTFDTDIDQTLIIKIDNSLAATASISGKVLKCIAVKKEYKNLNLTGNLLTSMITREYQKGNTNLFLFTKPENKIIFLQLGFFPVYEIKDAVILMENNPNGLNNFTNQLKKESEGKKKDKGKISSIVVNCNPITNGHLYLIEKAAAESDILHLFVVSEDRSVFPFQVRYQLIKEATAHIDNVILHTGSDYIISNTTFPSYFIKDSKTIVDIHARLDLGIFSEKIAPSLGITSRFAGDEPLCPVTSNYNRLMKEILPKHGIEFHIIRRFETGGKPVSASMVRKLLLEKDFDSIKSIVPPVTYNFLTSSGGEEIIKKLEKAEK